MSVRYLRMPSGRFIKAPLTVTARKKLRKTSAVASRAASHDTRTREAAQLVSVEVKPGLTAPNHPLVGDRAMVKHGKIGPRENVFRGGATGKITRVWVEHGVTMCILRLDKGTRISIRKLASELYFLADGEWRMPRPRPSHPEHESEYNTIWG